MAAETVSVVIPTWNGASLLPECLDSLLRQSVPPAEIVVADGASSDGTAELVERDYPASHLLRLGTNRGYTGAANAGILHSSGTLVAIVNQDVVLEPSWIEEVIRAAQVNPFAGAIATKIMLYDERDHFHSAGDDFRVDGIPVNRGVWEKDIGQYDVPAPVFGACGGAAVYRRKMLDQVGLLDESFFMYCEDVDLAWRQQLAGWPTIYAPRAVAYHHLGASGGGVLASYFTGRNTLYVLVKDLPGPLWRKHGHSILRAQLRISSQALRAWRGAAARARLKGQLAGLLTSVRMLEKRRSIQRARQVDLSYLEDLLSAVD